MWQTGIIKVKIEREPVGNEKTLGETEVKTETCVKEPETRRREAVRDGRRRIFVIYRYRLEGRAQKRKKRNRCSAKYGN